MFRETCLVALGKRVVNLQILDPGSPRRLRLEIPRTVVAPKQDHLIVGTQSIKMQQTSIINAWSERESDSETNESLNLKLLLKRYEILKYRAIFVDISEAKDLFGITFQIPGP
jgi:hypothetical protein